MRLCKVLGCNCFAIPLCRRRTLRSLVSPPLAQTRKSRYHSFEDAEDRLHELKEHPHPVPPPLVVRASHWVTCCRVTLQGQLLFARASATLHRRCPHWRRSIMRLFAPSLQTDLNGDGKPEIITATPGGKLQILAPRRFGDGFAKAEVGWGGAGGRAGRRGGWGGAGGGGGGGGGWYTVAQRLVLCA